MRKQLKISLNENNVKKIFLVIIFFTFILLLYKNPFSERNLIPNLEPFPDSIHYLNPALNLATGHGLLLGREGRVSSPNVPFLYSLTLTPGFLLVKDVRFFYFTNVLLAFCGLLFFYKFLKKISLTSYIALLILFLYATNYFIYWYPNLPMAENLVLPLFLIALYLLVARLTIKNAIIAAIVGVGFYATKYASLILTITFLSLYLLKILLALYPVSKESRLSFKIEKKQAALPLAFGLSTLISFTVFFLAEFLKGNNILYQIYALMVPILIKAPVVQSEGLPVAVGSWFSVSYFSRNFPVYLGAITGDSMRFLWDFTPIVPKYIAIPALAGIFAGLFKSGYRFISFSLLILILMPIIFISTFYSNDARYIYNAIPSLLAGFGLFLNFVFKFFEEKKLQKVFYGLLLSFFLLYAFSNLYRLKYQIVLNLKYAETPWYYVSAKTFDDYFATLPKSQEPPILISSIPPYYIDFFNKSGFKQLPLSREQEFTKGNAIVWGVNDYSDFIKMYKKYIEHGSDLYVTNAGLGNTGYLYRDYNLIKDNFTLTEVKEGCLNTCNIFKLNPKNP